MREDPELIEIVGGNLKGLWARIDSNFISIYFFDEDEKLIDARLEAEIAEKESGVFIYSQGQLDLASTFGGWIGQGLRSLWKKSQYKRAQSQDSSEYIPLAVYPLSCAVAHCSEASTAFIRTSEQAEYEITRASDKLALAGSSSGLFTTSTVLGATLRDSIMDDLRELPEETRNCLVVKLIDKNTIVLSEYTKEQKLLLTASSMELSDVDFKTIEILLDEPAPVKAAMQADLAKMKSMSVEEETSSLNALLSKKQADANQGKYKKLITLCDEILSARLTSENSNLEAAGGVVGSLSLSLDILSTTGESAAINLATQSQSTVSMLRGVQSQGTIVTPVSIHSTSSDVTSAAQNVCIKCGNRVPKKILYCPQCGADR